MPEVEEASDIAIPPTPPIESTSSRASFTSCPPEEDRDAHAPRESWAGTSRNQYAGGESAIEEGVRQEPTPEPEARAGAEREKGEHVEDARIGVEEQAGVGSSAPSPEVQGESDVRMVGAAVDGQEGQREAVDNAPIYLNYPPMRQSRVCALIGQLQ